MAGERILKIGQRLDQLGAGYDQPKCPFFFFPSGERVLCFAQNGGEDPREVLTPGYFEHVTFIHSAVIPRLFPIWHQHTILLKCIGLEQQSRLGAR